MRRTDNVLNFFKSTNWKVRKNNRYFWLTFIPAVIVLITSVLAVFNVNVDLTGISSKLQEVVIAIFAVLGLLGVVNDPTSGDGLGDSQLAMTYTRPGINEDEFDDDVADDSEEIENDFYEEDTFSKEIE